MSNGAPPKGRYYEGRRHPLDMGTPERPQIFCQHPRPGVGSISVHSRSIHPPCRRIAKPKDFSSHLFVVFALQGERRRGRCRFAQRAGEKRLAGRSRSYCRGESQRRQKKRVQKDGIVSTIGRNRIDGEQPNQGAATPGAGPQYIAMVPAPCGCASARSTWASSIWVYATAADDMAMLRIGTRRSRSKVLAMRTPPRSKK